MIVEWAAEVRRAADWGPADVSLLLVAHGPGDPATRDCIAVGLFAEYGCHGEEDLPRLLSGAGATRSMLGPSAPTRALYQRRGFLTRR
jgi:hypothetical protein